MRLTDQQHQQLAQRLYRASQQRQPLSPLSDDHPEMETADSYAIQEQLASLHGSPGIGYKLGFTSAAMRQQMGVSEPNFGVLFATTRAQDEVAHRQFIHPLVEPEIAVTTGRELSGSAISLAEIAAGVSSFHAALEIVDSRFIDYLFKAVDNIADNSSAAGYCLGEGIPASAVVDPAALQCRLFRNNQQIAEGSGADAMGGPYHALQWLVQKLALQNQLLPAGSLVLTGGLSRAQSTAAGDEFRVEFSGGLEPLALRFTNH
ncbi:MAG: fumarylacetoacetate hydrolase family protein [Gammaproteobacteria bacterium]